MTRAAAAVLLLLAALWLLWGLGAVGYDTLFSLAWGEDLAAGRLPELEGSAHPTPHPLAIAGGLVLAPLSDADALTAVSLGSLAALAVAGYAAFRLGRALFSVPVGLVFAAILVTRPLLLEEALQAFVDIPFLALVLLAAALEAERPRRGLPVLGLLAVAGLLRPEAWALSAVYAAWLTLTGEDDTRPRAVLAAVALSAPVAWILFDLVATGDPVHSLNSTRELAERIERPRGIANAVELAPSYLEVVLREPVAWAGLVGLVGTLALLFERALLPAALFALGLGAFLVLGLADLPLLQRYLLVPAAALGLFCAAALAAWPLAPRAARLPWALAATVLAVWVATSLPGSLDDIDETSQVLSDRGDLQRELHRLGESQAAARLLDSCRPVTVAADGLLASVALLREERTDGAAVAPLAPGRGVYVVSASAAARSAFGVGPEALRSARAAGLRRAAASSSWALFASCRP